MARLGTVYGILSALCPGGHRRTGDILSAELSPLIGAENGLAGATWPPVAPTGHVRFVPKDGIISRQLVDS
jgi:hypothetical protein